MAGLGPKGQARGAAFSQGTADAAWEHDHQLGFDDEERLPWLDSDDDHDDASAIATGRIVSFAAFGLVAVLAIVGAIWWLTAGSGTGDAVPDGSIVEAPAEPYKVRPEDAGGKEFEGTGDTSFAVGEGQQREGRLADASRAITEPVAPADPATAPAATRAETRPEPTASGPSINAVSSDAEEIAQANDGVGVQVGAYSTKAAAETGWQTLQRQTEVLNGVRHRVVRGRADIGIVYRLQAIAENGAAADRLCGALRDNGLDCQVKR